MKIFRQVLAVLIGLMLVGTSTLLAYGWWTRRGAPEFSRGGTFGAVESPTPGAVATVGGKRAKRDRPAARPGARATSSRAPVAVDPTEQGVAIPIPALGEYAYAGSGYERVTFGAASPCSWDIRDVSLVVNGGGRERVFDWTYSSQRVERMVTAYKPSGLYTTFVGSAVTCVGVRETQEDEYPRPALHLPLPIEVGERWQETVELEDRTERFEGHIVRRERITVPAGTFTAYVVKVSGTLSGAQEGTFEVTRWFSPELGLNVKEIVYADVQSGSIHFTSDMTLRLARAPG